MVQPDYFWPIITSAAAFGSCLGYMVKAIKTKDESIRGFNGDKQVIKEEIQSLRQYFDSLSERLNRTQTELDIMKRDISSNARCNFDARCKFNEQPSGD